MLLNKPGCFKTSLIILLLLPAVCSFSQNVAVGETMPDPTVKNVLGYRADSLKLSDFRGKLVILDFWGHFCSACLKALPKIDSLQKEFEQQVQFIMVNKESKESTIQLKAKRKYLQWPSIPMITADTILHNLFPPNGYPYHIWIDKHGRMAYATMGYNTTRENLHSYFEKSNLVLKSFYDRPDIKATDCIDPKELIYGSFLTRGGTTRYVEKYDRPDVTYRAEFKASIRDLFTYAFSQPQDYDFYPDYTTDLEVDSLYKYIYPADPNLVDSWVAKHSYDYHLMLPYQEASGYYNKMQQDLQYYFNINASIVPQKVKGYVLKKLKGFKNSAIRGEKPFSNMNTFSEGTDSICHMINMPFKELADHLKASLYLHYPFRDKTGITGNIDIKLSCKSLYPLDIAALQRDLKKYHLTLEEEMIMLPVLVLKQKPRE